MNWRLTHRMRHLLGDTLWWITVHANRLSLSIDSGRKVCRLCKKEAS